MLRRRTMRVVSTILHRQPSSWRHADGGTKVAGEMRLVGKTRLGRRTRQTAAGNQQRLGQVQTTHDEVAVRTGAKQQAEMPRQDITIEPCQCFQRFRPYRLRTMAMKKIARPQHSGSRDRRGCLAGRAGLSAEPGGDAPDRIVDGQIVRLPVEIGEKIRERPPEFGVGDNRIGDERQRAAVAIDCADQVRRQVDHAIDQSVLRSGSAIVHLVGVQHDHSSRMAEALRAAVAERLDAMQGQPQREGVVSMR